MSKHWREWTNRDIDYLRANYRLIPVEEIAETLERTVGAVIAAAWRFQIPNRHYRKSEADHKQIALLTAQGKTVKQIAEIVGMSRSTIQWHISAMPKWVREKSLKNGRKSIAKASRQRLLDNPISPAVVSYE